MTVSRPPAVLTILLWIVLEVIAAWQVRTPEGTPVLAMWIRSVARPLAWSAEKIGHLIVDASLGTTDLQQVIVDNRSLQLEVERLSARNMLLEEDIAAFRDADELLRDSAGFSNGAVIARCTFRDLAAGSMEVRTASTIYLPRDTPAITGGGLVGRVVRSEGSRHWLQLITHGAAAAAVQTPDSDVQGLVVGTGGETLTVAYVPRQARLEKGQVLITSGGDGIFPPGISAATVVRVRETENPFLEIGAEPTADLRTTRIVMLLPLWSASGGGEAE
ncbi:MAG: rod shape-determining protein MreC [Acidobacteriota bacterium]|nr:rod shape-determining protein MreC [Acidobacteriota bacterium]